MLRPTSIFLHDRHMNKLTALAESKGLKAAQLVRVAIAEYIKRNPK